MSRQSTNVINLCQDKILIIIIEIIAMVETIKTHNSMATIIDNHLHLSHIVTKRVDNIMLNHNNIICNQDLSHVIKVTITINY